MHDGRTKHIGSRYHYLRDQVSKGKVEVVHCRTEVQEADILTKGLSGTRFRALRQKLGVMSVENQN